MTNLLHVSEHSRIRMKQRGLRPEDVDFIVRHGTRCGDKQYLSRSDVNWLINEAKQTIARASRLKGKTVVVSDDTIVTVYHDRYRSS